MTIYKPVICMGWCKFRLLLAVSILLPRDPQSLLTPLRAQQPCFLQGRNRGYVWREGKRGDFIERATSGRIQATVVKNGAVLTGRDCGSPLPSDGKQLRDRVREPLLRLQYSIHIEYMSVQYGDVIETTMTWQAPSHEPSSEIDTPSTR
jgi:hypothetical protein